MDPLGALGCWSLGFRVHGLGAQCLGFRAHGLNLGVQGSGFKGLGLRGLGRKVAHYDFEVYLTYRWPTLL